MHVSRFTGALAGALLMLATGVLLAQSDKGTITGTVADSSGAVVQGAAITAVQAGTNLQRRTQTTETGRFTLPELPAGTYSIGVSLPGFKSYNQTGITVDVAQTASLNITLQVGQATESVEVHADASLLNVDNAEVSTTVKNSYITELPLDFSQNIRNPYGFLKLVPGASVSKDASWLMTSQNGLQSFSEEIRVDGASSTNPTAGVITEVQPSVDAVEEFTVQTNNYNAEYGSASGSIINFSLRSGTNDPHGTMYGFLRNEDLNAADKDTGINPRQRRTDFGATFGGPVVLPKLYHGRNKTFFFFSYEQFWSRENPTQYWNVPRDEWRNGDLSSILRGDIVGQDALGRDVRQGQIYDPASLFYVTGADGQKTAVRNPFPGNLIPTDRISPVALKILSYVPKATIPGVDNNNLIGVGGNPSKDIYIGSVKLDHNFSDRHRISASLNYEAVNKLNGADPYGTATGERNQTIRSKIFRFNDDYTISPTMLNHLTLGFMRYRNPDGASQHDGFNQVSSLGLNGAANGNWFPWVQYGLDDIGAKQASVAAHVTPTVNESFTWIKGSHTFKFGGEWRKALANAFDGSLSWGQLTFQSNQTAQPSLSGSDAYYQTGKPFASFLLGQVDSAQMGTPTALSYRYADWGFFAQDDFKITSKLTVSYGLRWDIHIPVSEKYGRISSFQPDLPNPGAGGALGAVGYLSGPNAIKRNSFLNTDYSSIGPRLGVAYQANSKTVFRGGFGVTYGRLELNSFGTIQNTGVGSIPFVSPQINHVTDAMFTLEQGFLPINGSIYDPSVANNSGIGYFSPESGKLPRIYNWNITIQRELGPNTSIEAGWVANHGTRLLSPAKQFNQNNFSVLSMGGKLDQMIGSEADAAALGVKYPYPGFSGTLAQALRPYPQYQGIGDPQATIGTSDYNSLQVKFKNRFSHGFDALVTYTLSKALTDVDDALAWGGGGLSGVDVNNLKLNRGLLVDTYGGGRGDRTHQISAALTYELPFKNMVRNKALKYAAGGWKLNGIVQYQTGEALSMGFPNPLGSYVFNGAGRMNIVAGQSLTSACSNNWPGACSLLNPEAFASTPAFTVGDAARTYGVVRGHPWLQEDLSVAREFAVTEHRHFEFRMEAINAFNRSVFGDPDTNPLDPIYEQGGRMVGYGTFWGRKNVSRQMQAMLKFVF